MLLPPDPARPTLAATRRAGRRPPRPPGSRRRASRRRAPVLLAAATVALAAVFAGCGDSGPVSGPVSRPAVPESDNAGERLAEFGPERLTGTAASRFAALALDCVLKEYPNKVALRLASDGDLAPPRELTPVFYGCFDWHSAVHGHWLLARLTRRFPEADFAAPAREALDRNLTAERVAGEIAYVSVEGRRGFERPYGLAWLLQLDAELFEWAGDAGVPAADRQRAGRLREMLAPLTANAGERLREFLEKLEHPVRVGEHKQTAFAAGLIHDWARSVDDAPMRALLGERARVWYGKDRDCPVAYEPSGQDFLSPCLAEADFMRRALPAEEFARWLDSFLPAPLGPTLEPVAVPRDEEDAFGHLHGLHLSRAWMLRGVAQALPEGDPRRAEMTGLAVRNAEAGLAGVDPGNYLGSHWLGSFAVYLLTRRGG